MVSFTLSSVALFLLSAAAIPASVSGQTTTTTVTTSTRVNTFVNVQQSSLSYQSETRNSWARRVGSTLLAALSTRSAFYRPNYNPYDAQDQQALASTIYNDYLRWLQAATSDHFWSNFTDAQTQPLFNPTTLAVTDGRQPFKVSNVLLNLANTDFFQGRLWAASIGDYGLDLDVQYKNVPFVGAGLRTTWTLRFPRPAYPSITPSPTASPSTSASASASPSRAPSPSSSPSPSRSARPTSSPTPSRSPSKTPAPSSSSSKTPRPTRSPSRSPSPSPSSSRPPSSTPSPSSSVRPSATASATAHPTPSVTAEPSSSPTAEPTPSSSASVEPSPSSSASVEPSPSSSASAEPSPSPSASVEPSPSPSNSVAPVLPVRVTSPTGGNYNFQFTESTTVGTVRQTVADATGVSLERQTLTYGNVDLTTQPNERTLDDLNIAPNAVITLGVKLITQAEAASLTSVKFAMAWSNAQGRIDLDGAALVYGFNNQFINHIGTDVGNQFSAWSSHSGDDTGSTNPSVRSAETITVNLANLAGDTTVKSIYFVISSYNTNVIDTRYDPSAIITNAVNNQVINQFTFDRTTTLRLLILLKLTRAAPGGGWTAIAIGKESDGRYGNYLATRNTIASLEGF